MAQKLHKKKRHGNCKDFLDWDTARQVIRDEMIGSRREYHQWLKLYNPPLAYSPYHVYPQWKSWNDYLGVNTTFPISRFFWPYKKAWDYARQCPARTRNEWMVMYRENLIVKEIPARPDCHYKGQFTGWRSFLGVSMKPSDAILQSQLEMSEHSQLETFYIGYMPGSGMYIIASDKSMLASCSSILAWDIDNKQLLQSILAKHCSHQGGYEYYISNPNEFKFEMDTTFIPHPQSKSNRSSL